MDFSNSVMLVKINNKYLFTLPCLSDYLKPKKTLINYRTYSITINYLCCLLYKGREILVNR